MKGGRVDFSTAQQAARAVIAEVGLFARYCDLDRQPQARMPFSKTGAGSGRARRFGADRLQPARVVAVVCDAAVQTGATGHQPLGVIGDAPRLPGTGKAGIAVNLNQPLDPLYDLKPVGLAPPQRIGDGAAAVGMVANINPIRAAGVFAEQGAAFCVVAPAREAGVVCIGHAGQGMGKVGIFIMIAPPGVVAVIFRRGVRVSHRAQIAIGRMAIDINAAGRVGHGMEPALGVIGEAQAATGGVTHSIQGRRVAVTALGRCEMVVQGLRLAG